eukprot:m.200855 g.200855  ORF g.200855 m.200855 type:complete len:686 (-) comp15740_c0_seq21:1916-3973(-)
MLSTNVYAVESENEMRDEIQNDDDDDSDFEVNPTIKNRKVPNRKKKIESSSSEDDVQEVFEHKKSSQIAMASTKPPSSSKRRRIKSDDSETSPIGKQRSPASSTHSPASTSRRRMNTIEMKRSPRRSPKIARQKKLDCLLFKPSQSSQPRSSDKSSWTTKSQKSSTNSSTAVSSLDFLKRKQALKRRQEASKGTPGFSPRNYESENNIPKLKIASELEEDSGDDTLGGFIIYDEGDEERKKRTAANNNIQIMKPRCKQSKISNSMFKFGWLKRFELMDSHAVAKVFERIGINSLEVYQTMDNEDHKELLQELKKNRIVLGDRVKLKAVRTSSSTEVPAGTTEAQTINTEKEKPTAIVLDDDSDQEGDALQPDGSQSNEAKEEENARVADILAKSRKVTERLSKAKARLGQLHTVANSVTISDSSDDEVEVKNNFDVEESDSSSLTQRSSSTKKKKKFKRRSSPTSENRHGPKDLSSTFAQPLGMQPNFTAFIQLLISGAQDQDAFYCLAEDNYYHSARQFIHNALSDRKNLCVASGIWTQDFRDTIEKYPNLRPEAAPTKKKSNCEACRRKNHEVSHFVVLTGSPYDPVTFEKLEEEPTTMRNSSQIIEFRLGPSCKDRVDIFHKLHHFEFKLYTRCARKVKEIQRKRSSDMAEVVDSLMNDEDWQKKLFNDFQNTLDCADKFLS